MCCSAIGHIPKCFAPCYVCRGLSPSRLDLPKTVDALWTVKKSHEAGPATRKPPSPDVIANLPLLKEQPQTAHEHAECSEALSEAELRSLIVGPKVVDFGKVSPALAATQYFVVKNPLGRAIQVVLDLQAVPELSKSAPVSQVIPAGESSMTTVNAGCVISVDGRTTAFGLDVVQNSSCMC